MHKLTKPHWETFEEHYSEYFPKCGGAPTEPPTDVQLYQQAQRAAPDTNAGMDGENTYELKLLPLIAETKRRRLLCLSRKVHRSPHPYYALPKEDKLKPNARTQKKKKKQG